MSASVSQIDEKIEVKVKMPGITTYETVLNTIRQWPPGRRFTLVQDVLNTLAPKITLSHSRRKTLQEALGLLATGQPAPSDAQVRQWLNERRMEKYANARSA